MAEKALTTRALGGVLLLGLIVSTGLVFARARAPRDQAPAAAPSANDAVAIEHAPTAAELAENRQRWEQMSTAEKELLLERYRQWKRMDPEEKRVLLERLQRYQAFETRLREDPPPGMGDDLSKLDPVRERVSLRERIHRCFREYGQSMRAKLPPAFLARLVEAAPEKRPEMIRQFRLQQIDYKGRILLDYLAQELGLSDSDVKAIQAQPLDQRVEILRSLRREHIEKIAQDGEPPAGFTRERWNRLSALSDREFFDRIFESDVPALRRRLGRPGPPGPPPVRGPFGLRRQR